MTPTPGPDRTATDRHPRFALRALLLGNLTVGTATLAPTGMLNELAVALSVSIARAGSLVWVGAIVVGIGAPLLAWWASAIDRRRLLIIALLCTGIGSAASALTTDFALQLALRILVVIGAAIFTPQAAAAVGLLVPGPRRAQAVAFVFLGWSVASALGLPLASYVGARVGWQGVYALFAIACLLQAALIRHALPSGLVAPAISTATWATVVRHRRLRLLLSVTAFQMAGQFTLFAYIAPEIRRRISEDPSSIAMLLFAYGAAGVAGNVIATRVVGRTGPGRGVVIALAAVVTGLLLLSVEGTSPAMVAAAMIVWGLGGFAANSMQQARLIAAEPMLASATVALNTSALYFGWAIGGALGAALMTAAAPHWLAPAAAAIVGLAIAASLLADRTTCDRPPRPPASPGS